MNAVTLYGFPGSTYVRTARMVCEEKRIPYTLSPLEFRSESHRALHPFLRMPAMRAGDVLLFETLAIATYLDGTGEARPLQPAAPPDRARMLQWVRTTAMGPSASRPRLTHGHTDTGERPAWLPWVIRRTTK
jgi:glutathione S-transferase